MDNVFYVPGQPWVFDYACVRADGVTVSQLQGLTLEQIQGKQPGAILTTFENAREQIESGCKSDPRPIDKTDFDYGLNVLPPFDWRHAGDSESFKLSELTNGRVTAIYVRLGATYWVFQDIFTLSHEEIIAKVLTAREGVLTATTS